MTFSKNGLMNSVHLMLVERHPEVYEPCDDSFAMVDSLELDISFLKEMDPSICIEIGSGSGYVLTFLGIALQNVGVKGPLLIGTDINPFSVKTSLLTAKNHNLRADFVQTSFVDCMYPRLQEKVDVIIFNPPYVPTPSEEVQVPGISAAWAGGNKGREVIDGFLPKVPQLLKQGGVFYLLTISENDPKGIITEMEKFGLFGVVLLERKTEEESISVLKFIKQKK